MNHQRQLTNSALCCSFASLEGVADLVIHIVRTSRADVDRLMSARCNLRLAEICKLLKSAAKSEHDDQLAILVTRKAKERSNLLEALALQREKAA